MNSEHLDQMLKHRHSVEEKNEFELLTTFISFVFHQYFAQGIYHRNKNTFTIPYGPYYCGRLVIFMVFYWTDSSSILHSATFGVFNIINKLLYGSSTSGSFCIVVSLPVLSLTGQVPWNRCGKPGEEEPSSQSRVQRFFQICPTCTGPVDIKLGFDFVPIFLQTFLNNSLSISNLVHLRNKSALLKIYSRSFKVRQCWKGNIALSIESCCMAL